MTSDDPDARSGRRAEPRGASRRSVLRTGGAILGATTLPGTVAADAGWVASSDDRSGEGAGWTGRNGGRDPTEDRSTARARLPVDGEFEETDPEAVALDPDALEEAIEYATRQNASSVRVYRHNYLVETSRRDALTGDLPANVFSTTKSVTSLLVGRAQERGFLDVRDPIGDYLDVPGASEDHLEVTIRQLLTQSSGLHFDWASEATEVPPDTVRYALSLPFDREPGTHFEYAQITCTVLTAVVEAAVGRDVQAFAQSDLFGPLGIDRREWVWRRDRSGNTHGWAHLHAPPTMLARLGHLLANDGVWRDERLLDRRFVREAREPTETNPAHGYLIWTNAGDRMVTPIDPGREVIEGPKPLVRSAPAELFMFRGLGGQNVYVMPELDVVVVRTGLPGDDEWEHEFCRRLMRAVEDVDVPDPGPYEGVDSAPVDLGHWVDPTSVLGSVGVGPRAPEGCTALGCDGSIALEGVLADVGDAVATLGWKVTGG